MYSGVFVKLNKAKSLGLGLSIPKRLARQIERPDRADSIEGGKVLPSGLPSPYLSMRQNLSKKFYFIKVLIKHFIPQLYVVFAVKLNACICMRVHK